MVDHFESKVVLITGGNSGIGQATALAFANKGAKVIVAARRVSEGKATVAMIKETGGEAHFVPTDVSKATEVEALIAACISNYGGLDYAVNNAGISGTPFTPAAEYEEEIWDKVIDINLKGVWLCMKYEIPEMLKRGQGAIMQELQRCTQWVDLDDQKRSRPLFYGYVRRTRLLSPAMLIR